MGPRTEVNILKYTHVSQLPFVHFIEHFAVNAVNFFICKYFLRLFFDPLSSFTGHNFRVFSLSQNGDQFVYKPLFVKTLVQTNRAFRASD